jgi:hypothetical protein
LPKVLHHSDRRDGRFRPPTSGQKAAKGPASGVDALIPVGDVQPSRGQRPRIRSPRERPTLKGSHPGGGRPATLSGLGPGRGTGTRRALPDATFCGPFRAKRLGNSGVDLL